MFTKWSKNLRCQKGFTLIELMVVVAILGILAAIAIPRFTNSTVAANTSKVAADLRTIESAISVFQANDTTNAAAPTGGSTGNLVTDGYLAAWPTPPTGSVYINGTSTAVPATTYTISTSAPYRALLDTHHAEDFHK